MKRNSNRVISLAFAIVCLFSACGIAFAAMFPGVKVFAASANINSVAIYKTYDENDSTKNEMLTNLQPNTKIAMLNINIFDPKLSTNFGALRQDKIDELTTEKASLPPGDARITEIDAILAKLNNTTDVVVYLSINTDTFKKSTDSNPNLKYKTSVGTPQPLTPAGSGADLDLYFQNVIFTGRSDILTVNITYKAEGANPDDTVELHKHTVSGKLTNWVSAELYSSTPRDNSSKDKDDDDKDDVEIPPPTPTIIVTHYDYGGGVVAAAQNFKLDITFTNTSSKLPVDNIVMKLTVPEAFTLTSSSNTFYIDRIAKNESVTRSVNLSVKPNADPISHPIKLDFAFECVILEQRKAFTSNEEISIPVQQLDRFSLTPVEVPPQIYVGEDMPIEVSFVNKGKTEVYNVSAEITGNNISLPGQRQFIGNIASGKEETVDFLIGGLIDGPVEGEVVITYEDANMNVNTLTSSFTTQAVDMNMGGGDMMEDWETMNPGDMGMMEEELPWYRTVPVWGWVAAGVCVIIILAYIAKMVKARKQAKELEQLDEDF